MSGEAVEVNDTVEVIEGQGLRQFRTRRLLCFITPGAIEFLESQLEDTRLARFPTARPTTAARRLAAGGSVLDTVSDGAHKPRRPALAHGSRRVGC
jgi:hypothetical protein